MQRDGPSTIGESDPAELQHLLAGAGLGLNLGAATVGVRSKSTALAQQVAAVYRHFPLVEPGPFADLRVEMQVGGWRRFVRPQVRLDCDGEEVFAPFPADTALPMFEWGANWFLGQRLNHVLLFHAGCVERDGLGLLLPAVPGSGKSTLTSALCQSGWRLLSDEFGVCDPRSLELQAMLKPIALKNESIGVVRNLYPDVCLGPAFPRTRKGTVAHVSPSLSAVRRRCVTARPAAVVLPRWTLGAPTTLEQIDEEAMFKSLAYNSFNYEVLGEVGFRTVVALVRRCRGWRLEYGDLKDAVARLDALWHESILAPSGLGSIA